MRLSEDKNWPKKKSPFPPWKELQTCDFHWYIKWRKFNLASCQGVSTNNEEWNMTTTFTKQEQVTGLSWVLYKEIKCIHMAINERPLKFFTFTLHSFTFSFSPSPNPDNLLKKFPQLLRLHYHIPMILWIFSNFDSCYLPLKLIFFPERIICIHALLKTYQKAPHSLETTRHPYFTIQQ